MSRIDIVAMIILLSCTWITGIISGGSKRTYIRVISIMLYILSVGYILLSAYPGE
jgi:hypothetical protein